MKFRKRILGTKASFYLNSIAIAVDEKTVFKRRKI